jgi:hypothetical protein
MRKWTSFAPACRRNLTSEVEVVPRTRESSTTTIRFPATTSRTGLYFIRAPKSRSAWDGLMKVRPT